MRTTIHKTLVVEAPYWYLGRPEKHAAASQQPKYQIQNRLTTTRPFSAAAGATPGPGWLDGRTKRLVESFMSS